MSASTRTMQTVAETHAGHPADRPAADRTRDRAFYLFVLCYAAQRFLWEFLKPYPRLLGPLDVFQLLALGMILYALVYDARARRARHA